MKVLPVRIREVLQNKKVFLKFSVRRAILLKKSDQRNNN
jgi:hypothetical protein